MTSLGAVLEGFPDEVVVYITDPRTGIQRRSKWPPTISEVIEAAEDHIEHLAKLRAPKASFIDRPPAQLLRDRPPGYCAQIHVPEGHPRYAALVEWTGEAQNIWWLFGKSSDGVAGLWVSHEAWNSRQRKSA